MNIGSMNKSNMDYMNYKNMQIGRMNPDDQNYIICSGFCCLIPLENKNKKIPVLITCIKKETLIAVKQISIQYDNGNQNFQMNINDYSKIYSNDAYGITIIEMENYNEKYNQLVFMDIDEDIFNSKDFLMENFYNKKAYILEYAKPHSSKESNENNGGITKKNLEEFTKDKQYTIEEGKIIIQNDKYYIIHNIPTNYGASGGPIISHNKFKVIGYHMGRQKNCNTEYIGFGYLLKLPIEEFIKEYYS
jgi:V8-like Glu-specific endopeptidase